MRKFISDFKLPFLVFAIFFAVTYVALWVDHYMGWEQQRAIENSYIGNV